MMSPLSCTASDYALLPLFIHFVIHFTPFIELFIPLIRDLDNEPRGHLL